MIRGRRPRRSQEEQSHQTEANKALKSAFKHEVRPQDYLLRVWITSILAGAYFAYVAATKNGSFDINTLVPLGGWHGHDANGGLYMETWASILADSLQAGYALWGAALIFLGVFRIVTEHKYVFACFWLGIMFIGLVVALPGWIQILLNMLIDKCPILVQ
ncbi:unnamed protein product [Sphagnum balticum]